jgi:hypothetical protein
MGEGAHTREAKVKALPIAAGVIILSLGIIAAVVFGLGDRETLVSPPESVAEEFIRSLGHGRVEAARDLLSSEEERATSPAEMKTLTTRFRSRLGRLDHVDASVSERGRDSAEVRVDAAGSRDTLDLAVPLAFEHGLWKVARVSEVERAVNQR